MRGVWYDIGVERGRDSMSASDKFYVDFLLNDDKSRVRVFINSGLDSCKPCWNLYLDVGGQENSILWQEHLAETMRNALATIRRNAYHEGFKDGKTRKTPRYHDYDNDGIKRWWR